MTKLYVRWDDDGLQAATPAEIVAALRADEKLRAEVLGEFTRASAAAASDAIERFRKERARAEAAEAKVAELEERVAEEDARAVEWMNLADERLRQLTDLQAQLRACYLDDPEMDATDGAHPAWWRGHDNGAKGMTALVEKLQAQLREREEELAKSQAAAVKTIGTLQEAIADVADGFEQQGKRGLASQLRQFLPAEAPAQASPRVDGPVQTSPFPQVAEASALMLAQCTCGLNAMTMTTSDLSIPQHAESCPARSPVQAAEASAQQSCCYFLPGDEDAVTGEIVGATPANCPRAATHISCQPYDGTPTCETHKCRCAKPIASNGVGLCTSDCARAVAIKNSRPSGQKEETDDRRDRGADSATREPGHDRLGRGSAAAEGDDRRSERGTEEPREGAGNHEVGGSSALGRRSDDVGVRGNAAPSSTAPASNGDGAGDLGSEDVRAILYACNCGSASPLRIRHTFDCPVNGSAMKRPEPIAAPKLPGGEGRTDVAEYDPLELAHERILAFAPDEPGSGEALCDITGLLCDAIRERCDPPSSVGFVTREELVAALQSIEFRTRNAAGETRMTGLLFAKAAEALAKEKP